MSNKVKLELPRGMTDMPPEDKIQRDQITNKIKQVFESFGFSPLDTPIVERFSVLSSKYAGGAEILKETFKLKDQGDRELGLRYDLTVPFARFIGMNPQTKMPFKRYQIDKVFRDGPIKLGRTREFYQCDADIVGSKEMTADFQCVEIAVEVFKSLNIDAYLDVSNRKVINKIIESAGVKEDKIIDTILIIDKLKKINQAGVEKELKTLGLKQDQIKKILNLITIKGTNKKKIEFLKKELGEFDGLKEIEELFSYVEKSKLKNVNFEPSLARGLAYYTGTVYEGFFKKSKVTSSICSGGRYDNMIQNFLQTKQEYPCVGISFGLEPIYTELKQENKQKTTTKVFIIPIKTYNESLSIASELREKSVNTDIDLNKRGISKNLDYASYYKIPYVLFIGEEEVKSKKYKLRDMNTGQESSMTIAQIIKYLD